MNDATDDTTSRTTSTAPAPQDGETHTSAQATAAPEPSPTSSTEPEQAAQAAQERAAREGEAEAAASSGASGAQSVPVSGSAPDAASSARADVERYKEQWMRAAADFDNFRKRSRREVEDAKRTGREDLLRELLPVFDNLERGIQSAQRATDVKAVADGLGMILKQFVDTLGRAGITKIAGVGSPFDPSVHEAIQQVETKDQPPGVVIAEVQPGYVQGDRLVRAAMVVVSKTPSDGGESTN